MKDTRDVVARLGPALVLITTACTPAAETQGSSATDPSGWSTNEAGAQTRATTASAADKPTRWEHADRLSTFRKAAPRARSQHLGGEHEAEVLTNEAAAAYPTLGPQRTLGAGAVLVEALYAPNQPEVSVYFVMTKQAAGTGAWEFLIVSSTGQVEQRGALPLCARCHAEAPNDHVFGRPR